MVEVDEFARVVGLRGDAFLRRVFVEDELSDSGGRPERLAVSYLAAALAGATAGS